MAKAIGKLLLWWAGTLIVLFYLAVAIVALSDGYARGGWGGFVFGAILLSVIPAAVIGAILSER